MRRFRRFFARLSHAGTSFDLGRLATVTGSAEPAEKCEIVYPRIVSVLPHNFQGVATDKLGPLCDRLL